MKQSKKSDYITFYVLVAVTLIVSVIDNLFTYLGSPDLSKEANPLVHTFGFSWTGLLTANVLVLALYVFVVYYAFIKYKPIAVPCNNKKEYLSFVFFGRPDKYISIHYKLPNNNVGYRYTLSCFGFGLAFIVPILRTIAAVEWTMYLFNRELFESYINIIRNYAVTTVWGRLDLLIAALILISILVWIWNNRQYKLNQKLISEYA